MVIIRLLIRLLLMFLLLRWDLVMLLFIVYISLSQRKNKGDINRIYSGSRKIFKIIGWVILLIIALVSLGLYFFYGFEDGYRK